VWPRGYGRHRRQEHRGHHRRQAPGQGWHVTVDGDVPLDVAIRFTWPTEEERARSGYGNANRPVNAVPYVCEPPGVLSTFTMPHIIARLG
jgi:hypothetical protein